MYLNIIINIVGLLMLTIMIFAEKNKKEKETFSIIIMIVGIIVDFLILLILYPLYDLYAMLLTIVMTLVCINTKKLERNRLLMAIIILIAITIGISIYIGNSSTTIVSLFINIFILIILVKIKSEEKNKKMKVIKRLVLIIQILNIIVLVWFIANKVYTFKFECDNENKYILREIENSNQVNKNNENLSAIENTLTPSIIDRIDTDDYYEIDIKNKQVDYRHDNSIVQTFGGKKLAQQIYENENRRILIKRKKLTQEQAQKLKKILDNYIQKNKEENSESKENYYRIEGTEVTIKDIQKINDIIK